MDAAPHLQPGFREVLGTFDLAVLEAHDSPVYGLWPDLTLAYLNPAWFEFALKNDGEPGISAKRGVGSVHPRCHRRGVARLLRGSATRARGRRRSLAPRLRVPECRLLPPVPLDDLPPRGGTRASRGPLPLPGTSPRRAGRSAGEGEFLDRHGLLHQCGHCRRFRHASGDRTWAWIAEWVRRPPVDVSHGLCPVCVEYYYPELS